MGEVLNLQIIALMPLLLAVVAYVAGSNVVGLLSWLSWAVVVGYGYAVGAVGAWKAWHGIAWTYPLNLRVVATS